MRGAALTQLRDRCLDLLRRDAVLLEDFSGLAFGRDAQAEQQALGRHEGIARLGCGPLRRVERAHERGCGVEFIPAAGHFRQRLYGRINIGPNAHGVSARRAQQTGAQAFAIIEQRLQKVLRLQLLILLANGDRLRCLQKAARALGELLQIHVTPRLFERGDPRRLPLKPQVGVARMSHKGCGA